MAEVHYRTYFVQNSKTREVEEKSFDGSVTDGDLTPLGVPEHRALVLMNKWNRLSATQAHYHGNLMFTYFLR